MEPGLTRVHVPWPRFKCCGLWFRYRNYIYHCARASKLNQQICILPELGRSSKSTHTGVEIDICAFQTGCQLSRAASGISLGLCLLYDFSGMKRMCWTTGRWWCCLSLEVASSIPAGSTIIHRFFCGFISACVTLWRQLQTRFRDASPRASVQKQQPMVFPFFIVFSLTIVDFSSMTPWMSKLSSVHTT